MSLSKNIKLATKNLEQLAAYIIAFHTMRKAGVNKIKKGIIANAAELIKITNDIVIGYETNLQAEKEQAKNLGFSIKGPKLFMDLVEISIKNRVIFAGPKEMHFDNKDTLKMIKHFLLVSKMQDKVNKLKIKSSKLAELLT